jgi:hypothetical protein
VLNTRYGTHVLVLRRPPCGESQPPITNTGRRRTDGRVLDLFSSTPLPVVCCVPCANLLYIHLPTFACSTPLSV